MQYQVIEEAIFLERPNRFIAKVRLKDGREEVVHVKNTGRCKELLIPGCKVFLSYSEKETRKTKFDLVAVVKNNGLLINIDSQAPNVVMKDWLKKQNFTLIKPEYTYGSSRIDFYLENGSEKILLEVKGCTLENNGIGYFPDAPTTRGVKHLEELTYAKAQGYRSVLAFVIQIDGITEVRPNIVTHPEFAKALDKAQEAGVEVWFMTCHIESTGFAITSRIIKNKSNK